MIGNPDTAPPRTDLAFLRRRSRPRAAASAPPPGAAGKIDFSRPGASRPAASGSPAPTGHVDYTRRDRSPSPSPSPSSASAASSSGGLDLSRPAPAPSGAGGLDLSAPSPPAASGSSTPGGSSSLDLGSDAPPAGPVGSSASLDLDGPPRSTPTAPGGRIDFSRPGRTPPAAAAPAPAPASPPGSLDLSDVPALGAVPPPPPARPTRPVARVRSGEQALLRISTPTVTLTRLQSGIGTLNIDAVCSPEIGDLRIGAVYQLRSGGSSTVQLAGGNRFAPSPRRPVLVAHRDEYDRISVDLRQVDDLERLAVYAFSESRTALTWGGTLVLDTFGGARVELPLDTLYAGAVAVLMSIYNVDGELVVRSELETIAGDVREAARAYGYDRITWRDERTPVD